MQTHYRQAFQVLRKKAKALRQECTWHIQSKKLIRVVGAD
jgi:hypothetical protein